MTTGPAYKFNVKRIGNIIEVYYIDCNGYVELIHKSKVPVDGQWRDDVEYIDGIVDVTRKRIRKSSFFCRR